MSADQTGDIGTDDLARRDIDVVVTHGSALHRHQQFERVFSVDRLATGERYDVTLLSPVDERPLDVALVDAARRITFGRHQLRLELSLQRCDLPSGRTVIREDARRPLERKLEPEEIGPFDFANDL